jgi:protein phosphatase 1 regulatory subunit 42
MHAKLLLKRSNRNIRKNETIEDAMRSLTHLHMCDLGIESLEPERLSLYGSCICLYVYDNRLTTLHGIDCLDCLQELQAQNNQISEIPELGPFMLTRLDLRHNLVSRVTGLSQQPALRELYLSAQNVAKLEMPAGCLASQSRSLEVLEIAECGIDDLAELRCLENLKSLNLARNQIASFDELSILLKHLTVLHSVDLRGNPICRVMKYREKVIVMGNFAELDEKKIVKTQQETLKRMQNRKPPAPKRPPSKAAAPLHVRHLDS